MRKNFTLMVLVMCVGCMKVRENDFKYDLENPDYCYVLPKQLKEISGISFVNDTMLFCVEDEHGILYGYDLTSEKIIQEITFASTGDFEDVFVANDTVFVLRSDGVVSEVTHRYTLPIAREVTAVQAGHDFEGLVRQGNMFLLADKETKSLYFLDPGTGETLKTLSLDTDNSFAPSAIAIHPVTGHLYILGTAGKRLIVMTQDGEILHSFKLKESIFKQPEGIAFNSSGDLYISNEGRNGKSDILCFRIK